VGDFASLNLGGHVGDDPLVVESNRTIVAKAFGVKRDRLLFMNQRHGADVVVVDGSWEGEAPEADGLVTISTDLVLAVLVADCTPVLLVDRVAGVVVFIGFAVPTFWLALLLMILFGVHLGWLPISGIRSLNSEYLPPGMALWDLIRHLILPVLLAAFGGLAGLSRYMRANMLEVIRQDYILTARAKGLSERVVIYRHALRNALLPVITILGLSVPGLIGGSVIFETIFAIPGMGQLFYMAVMARDYPVVMGILFIGAVLTLLGNLLADVSYALADPRIRVS